MTELVTILSTGKNTWGPVAKLIKNHEWTKIVIITNKFGSEHFNKGDNMEFVVIDQDDEIVALFDSVKSKLKELLVGPQVALNLESGSGKEHMAVLSSLLKLGFAVRLVHFDGEIKEL